MLDATPENVNRFMRGMQVDADAARTATTREVKTAVTLLALRIKQQLPTARFAVLRDSEHGPWMMLRWVGDASGERIGDETVDDGDAPSHLYVEYSHVWCTPFNYDYGRRHKRPTDAAADANTYLDLDKILES